MMSSHRILPYSIRPAQSLTTKTALRQKQPLFFTGHTSQDTYQTIESLQQKQVLSPRSKELLGQLLRQVPPNEIASLASHESEKQLTQLKAAVDTLFQFYKLEAAHLGILNKKTGKNITTFFSDQKSQSDNPQLSFEDLLTEIKKQPTLERASRKLKETIEASNNGTPTNDLLPLIYAQKLLLSNGQLTPDEWKIETHQKLLKNEVQELDKTLPRTSPRRLQLLLTHQAFSLFPRLPAKWFTKQIASVLSSQLRTPVKPMDLTHYMLEKQQLRQEFNYENPTMTPDEKKSYVKGFEKLLQASLLKKIFLRQNQGQEILFPKIRTPLLRTPLMTAAKKGDLADINETLKSSSAEALLDTINDRDIFGNTALMYACKNPDSSVPELLLNNGADLTIKNNRGKTAFDFLPKAQNGYGVAQLKVLAEKAPKIIQETDGIWLYPHI